MYKCTAITGTNEMEKICTQITCLLIPIIVDEKVKPISVVHATPQYNTPSSAVLSRNVTVFLFETNHLTTTTV